MLDIEFGEQRVVQALAPPTTSAAVSNAYDILYE
jgi:hypothetical protein